MSNLIRRLTPRTVRNWVRQPKRSVRYVLDRLAYVCIGCSEAQVRPDWRVRCHPASRNHFSVFASDPSQEAELDSFIKYCQPGMQFLDIGAHYGLFALAAARFGGAGARIVAVEASANASVVLKANIAANEAAGLVQVVDAAMGARDGAIEMLSTGPAGSDYFVSAPAGRPDTTVVRQVSMASVLCETRLRPTHIKMDVEGFESDVIEGGKNCLRDNWPILFLELHGAYLWARGHDTAQVVRQLRDCGYTRFVENATSLDDGDFSRRNFECRIACFPF